MRQDKIFQFKDSLSPFFVAEGSSTGVFERLQGPAWRPKEKPRTCMARIRILLHGRMDEVFTRIKRCAHFSSRTFRIKTVTRFAEAFIALATRISQL